MVYNCSLRFQRKTIPKVLLILQALVDFISNKNKNLKYARNWTIFSCLLEPFAMFLVTRWK